MSFEIPQYTATCAYYDQRRLNPRVMATPPYDSHRGEFEVSERIAPGIEQALGTISFAAFTHQSNPDARRPLAVVTNGGPVSASHWNMGWLGPVGFDSPMTGVRSQCRYNSVGGLSHFDILGLDPVGTGTGRIARDELWSKVQGVPNDIATKAAAIACWRENFGHPDQDILLIGSSYSIYRMAGLALELVRRDLPVQGILSISGRFDGRMRTYDQDIRPFQYLLPVMAATTHYEQHRYDAAGSLKAYQEAQQYAETTYVDLLTGNASPSVKRQGLQALHTMTGIPPGVIVQKQFRLDPPTFYAATNPGVWQRHAGYCTDRYIEGMEALASASRQPVPVERFLARAIMAECISGCPAPAIGPRLPLDPRMRIPEQQYTNDPQASLRVMDVVHKEALTLALGLPEQRKIDDSYIGTMPVHQSWEYPPEWSKGVLPALVELLKLRPGFILSNLVGIFDSIVPPGDCESTLHKLAKITGKLPPRKVTPATMYDTSPSNKHIGEICYLPGPHQPGTDPDCAYQMGPYAGRFARIATGQKWE